MYGSPCHNYYPKVAISSPLNIIDAIGKEKVDSKTMSVYT